MNRFIKCNVIFALMIMCFSVNAQAAKMDEIDAAIIDIFQRNSGNVLCLTSDSSLPNIRKGIDDYLQTKNTTSEPNLTGIAIAAYTIYPCPFSPYRAELRPATSEDVTGVWLYPEKSQKLRFGPKSPMWAKFNQLPIQCESVGYYNNGEARNAQILGKTPCPFSSAKSMDISRKNPNVVQWQMLKNGLLKITRSDITNHVEEWEIFYVSKPFEMLDLQFNEGELIAYLRRENGNSYNAATVFRHLQRLP